MGEREPRGKAPSLPQRRWRWFRMFFWQEACARLLVDFARRLRRCRRLRWEVQRCGAALERAGVSPDQVDEVIFGNVLGAGLGQNVARQVSIGAGLSPSIGATTVNKVCGSGLKSVMLAAQAIRCGDASVVVAGGTENMSRAPYLLERARGGYRLGDGALIDSMVRDGLWDVYNGLHMGLCGDRCAEKYAFSREEQDDFAVESYNRALAAVENGDLCRGDRAG